jgi:23S rRNA (uracil1939-C5)-methyltransferase
MSSPFDIRIEKLVYGGEGLSHHDQATVFVPYVIPGELVRIAPMERKKKFIRGRVEEILEPASDRTEPPCPRFGVCGGCHYQHIPYADQLKFKGEILRETLSRIGRIQWTDEIKTIASPPFGYRNRAQWAVRPEGVPPRPAIGYFMGGSSSLAPTGKCPILAPQLEETLTALDDAFHARKLPENVRGIECFADPDGKEMLLNVSVARSKTSAANLEKLFREIVPAFTSFLLQDEGAEKFDLIGPGYIHYAAGSFKFRVGHLSFFQVNRFLLDEMVSAVVGDTKGELALDLFAGVGLFSLPLVAIFKRVIAVEGNVATARDLEANLKDHPTSRYRHMDTESFLAQWKEKPDLVILDPPRAGVTAPALDKLRALGPDTITYLSCDPATLARDLAILTKDSADGSHRYLISNITLVDIFPQTYHIEALVRLQRLG